MPSEPNSCAWRAPNQTVEAEEALVPVAGTLDEASAAASPMLVAVTRDALRRLARADGSGAGGERDLDEAGCRAVFERHREFFRWLAGRKLARGEVGPFCTLLVTPDDLGNDAADRKALLRRRAGRRATP